MPLPDSVSSNTLSTLLPQGLCICSSLFLQCSLPKYLQGLYITSFVSLLKCYPLQNRILSISFCPLSLWYLPSWHHCYLTQLVYTLSASPQDGRDKDGSCMRWGFASVLEKCPQLPGTQWVPNKHLMSTQMNKWMNLSVTLTILPNSILHISLFFLKLICSFSLR